MLKGDLAATSIETVLTDLANEVATGGLHVVDDDGNEAQVYLRTGLIYAVSVPGQRPQLGTRLISSNALVPENLAEAVEAQRTELQGWRLGELLVHLGFTEQGVVEAFVQEQVRDGICDLLDWTTGRWRFHKNEKTREDIAPPTPVMTLLAEVATRRANWDDILVTVHGPTAVPMLAARGGEANVTLDPDTWALLCKVDGDRSISELADECGFTLYEAGTVVRQLVADGLIDVEEVLHVNAGPILKSVDDFAPEPRDTASRVAALAAAFSWDEDPDVAEPANEFGSPSEYLGNVDSAIEASPEPEDDCASALARVTEALTQDFGPARDLPFAEPFQVPAEIHLQVTPELAPTSSSDEERRARIRQEAADELAAAHAEADASRDAHLGGGSGSSGDDSDDSMADVVDLLARREAAQADAEEAAAARAETDRIAAEEAERIAAEQVEAELAAELAAAELAESERIEAERFAAEVAERIESERIAAEEAAIALAEQLEAERVAAELAEAELAEAERIAAELAAAEEAERIEIARIAAELAEAERAEAELAAIEEAAIRRETEQAEAAADLETEQVHAERAEAGRLTALEHMMAAQAAFGSSSEPMTSTDADDPSRMASATAMLAEFSRSGATNLLPSEDAHSELDDDSDLDNDLDNFEPDNHLPRPFVQRDLTDTASLLRELSSLGFEDEPTSSGGPRPGPSAPRPISAPSKKKRGLFGR